ncbi:hypothetical protein [Klebsiella phage vB_KpnP_ZX1]|nr:hypothetical protein [Klebsiella phage vB_KpnP_ZX1]
MPSGRISSRSRAAASKSTSLRSAMTTALLVAFLNASSSSAIATARSRLGIITMPFTGSAINASSSSFDTFSLINFGP